MGVWHVNVEFSSLVDAWVRAQAGEWRWGGLGVEEEEMD